MWKLRSESDQPEARQLLSEHRRSRNRLGLRVNCKFEKVSVEFDLRSLPGDHWKREELFWILHELFCALVLSSFGFLTKAEDLSRLGTCGVDLSQSKLPLDTDSSTSPGLNILRVGLTCTWSSKLPVDTYRLSHSGVLAISSVLPLNPETTLGTYLFEFADTNIANNAMQSEIATVSQSHRKLCRLVVASRNCPLASQFRRLSLRSQLRKWARIDRHGAKG
ncbi:hypothetical protein HDK77DRAFT_257880 [Phyllosticta capitalensis]